MIIWGKEKTSVREVSMKSKTLLWLIPLILLLLLIPLAVPSALPAAGAEDLPLWETVELTNPHPDPVPLDEKPPFAPDEAGWLPDEQGYVDGTIAVRLEKRVVNNTKVYITFVQIADPSQLRTASYKPYPQQAEIRATKLASREKAVVALNADWFVSNGGFGIIYRNGKLLRDGKNFSSFDAMIIDTNGDFHLFPSPTPEDFEPWQGKIMHSFCFGPALVKDGVLLPQADQNLGRGLLKKAQRQALCQMGPLQYLIVTCEGPEQSEGGGLTNAEMAQLCYDLGAQEAYNMDGGSSTWLVLNGQKINARMTVRPITDIVYFITAEPPAAEN